MTFCKNSFILIGTIRVKHELNFHKTWDSNKMEGLEEIMKKKIQPST